MIKITESKIKTEAEEVQLIPLNKCRICHSYHIRLSGRIDEELLYYLDEITDGIYYFIEFNKRSGYVHTYVLNSLQTNLYFKPAKKGQHHFHLTIKEGT
jgi:hypothetical protein